MSSHEDEAGGRGAVGAACALPEALIITPMEVAKLGLQLDGRRFQNSGVEVLNLVIRERGLFGAYVGFGGVLARHGSSR